MEFADLTYPEVGATRDGTLPAGYRHLRRSTRLGSVDLATAGEAVLTFRMHRATGVRVDASAERAAPGVEVVMRLGIGPLRTVAPCRVVWAVSGPDRAGFGYGTLPGHPVRGEESFVVHRDATGEVWFTVTSFSRPARWFMAAAGPLAPLAQSAYARVLGWTLRRVCALRASTIRRP
jgi:uncharacterized protein (UPF0548 family)